jgi:hypothetical protein
MADKDSDSKKFGDKYLGKLTGQLNTKAPVFGESLFAGAGTGTKNAWNQGTSFANSLISGGGYTAPMTTAMGKFGGLGDTYKGLATAYDPNSAAYQTLRGGIRDDVLTDVASLGASNGRYGSTSFNKGAAEGLGQALAGLDYTNMQNDVNNRFRAADSQAGIYSGMFDMGQRGIDNRQGAIDALSQIGAAQDANAQGALLGRADLFDRTKNAELDRLIKIGAAFGDPVGAANEAPFWQQGLGALLGFGGDAVRGGLFG